MMRDDIHEIHAVYGGGETPVSNKLVPGEISHGTMLKWRKSGIVVACIGDDHRRYAYDPEMLIFDGHGNPPTTHCVWSGNESSGGWRLLTVKLTFTPQDY